MFKYTPKKSILDRLQRARKNPVGNKEKVLASSLFKIYQMQEAFIKHWEHINLTTEKELDYIPVGGVPFPVEYFDKKKL